MSISHTRCPVCSSEDIRHLMTCSDTLTGAGQFDVFKCPQCLLEFLKECPDETEIEKYYNSPGYISHTDESTSMTGRVYYAVRRFMLARKRALVRKTARLKKGRILDIGSGTGHFAGFMKRSGWESEGIEKNMKAREYSSALNKIPVYSEEHLGLLPGNSYDCITMWHVLEHLPAPGETLSHIRRLLKPGASAIIALPNNLSFDSIFYRHYWAARDVPRHIWHFNPVSFMYLAVKNGFDVERIKRLPFDVFYISVLSEKNAGSRFPTMKGMIKGFIFCMLSLFDVARSSSVIYVIKPRAA